MNDLTRLAEWTVPEAEIDHLGHMSMLFYGRRADQGGAALLAALGLGAAELDAAGLVAATVDQHTMFRREQLVNAPLSLAGGVVAAESGRIGIYQEMRNDKTGDLAATFLSGVQLQDRATRQPAPIPAAAVQAAEARRIAAPARSQPRSLPLETMGADLTLDDLVRAGVESHLRREIAAEDCDAAGFLTWTRPRRLPPPEAWRQNAWGQGVMDQVWGSVDGFAWPALETRTLTLAGAREGDVLDSYTVLLGVTHKIIRSGTWTFEARSRKLVAVTQQVNIFFDLAARQTHEIPPEVRARISKLAHPELSSKRR